MIKLDDKMTIRFKELKELKETMKNWQGKPRAQIKFREDYAKKIKECNLVFHNEYTLYVYKRNDEYFFVKYDVSSYEFDDKEYEYSKHEVETGRKIFGNFFNLD